MKDPKHISIEFYRRRFSVCALLLFVAAAVSLALPLDGGLKAQTSPTGGDTSLSPWFGVWRITEDHPLAGSSSNPENIVEIKPTSDHRGLQITRKSASQPDVWEVLIPDGTKRRVNAENCTGWQTFKQVTEAGLILGSSEMVCKETGSFATSTLKMIVAADQMVEILSVKTAGQTRIAVRRLTFEHDLAPSQDNEAAWIPVAARVSRSVPWSVETIVHLSKSIETPVLEAALLEKKSPLSLNSRSLKQMKTAGVPGEIIDLTVALAYPDQFHIEKNGQVELRPWIESTSNRPPVYTSPPTFLSYYPGAFYGCYSPQGFYYGSPYSGFLSPGACLSYYSPFWWDYPIYIPAGRGAGGRVPGDIGTPGNEVNSGMSVATPSGYAQIEPVTQRHAIRRQDWNSGRYGETSSSASQGAVGTYSGSSSGASSGGSYGGGSASGGGSSAPSASPGGYSSGSSSGGGTAVPR